MNASAIVTLAQREISDALRNRWFIAYAGAFVVLSVALAVLIDSSAGYSGVSGFGRTSAGLINLVLFLAPLMGLTLGAQALTSERERGTLSYLLAQPVSLFEVFISKFIGLAIAIATAIVTGFARMDGQSVGIVASNPKGTGGVLDNNSADKAARFISLCDAFHIPLVFLQDIPGFMVGKKVEHEGIIRHGAKLIHAMSDATVPKITVVLRKAYGAGYFALAGREFGADMIFAWPSAEISVMGPEGAVNIMGRRMIEQSDDPEGTRAMLIAQFKKMIDVYVASGWSFIDDVIDPRETRGRIIRALKLAEHKKVERPYKKHGVSPV